MRKIYLDDVKTSGKTMKQPRKDVLNTILAFSEQLEVLKSKNKSLELSLN